MLSAHKRVSQTVMLGGSNGCQALGITFKLHLYAKCRRGDKWAALIMVCCVNVRAESILSRFAILMRGTVNSFGLLKHTDTRLYLFEKLWP